MNFFLYERARELLLAQLSAESIEQWLRPLGITDWRTAHKCLLRIVEISDAPAAVSDMLPYLLLTLSDAANPDRVLVNLERFIRSAEDKARLLKYLAENPRGVEILVRLFAGSQFLTEILLRNPEYFEPLIAHRRLTQSKTLDAFNTDLAGFKSLTIPALLDALRRYQRWEFLRIGMGDLLNLFDLPAVTTQLSQLADSLVNACLTVAMEQSGIIPEGFVILAMGKLGGGELNYSSDIDLLFLARTDAARYCRLGERLIDALTRVTGEGFLYRVDMRLRPWGQVGALVTSVDGYLAYLEKHARLWEKQALLKARPIAGDMAVGAAFLMQVPPLLFNVNSRELRAGVRLRASVREMKQRTESQLRRQGREWGEVKLGEGSIRDVEFVVQYLQLLYGAQIPDLHSHNTLDALARAAKYNLISATDYRILVDGYVFLRTIEHHLQMMHYRQTHVLPDDADALAHLARRLEFQNVPTGTTAAKTREVSRQSNNPGAQFLARYEQHRAAIRAIYLKYLGSDDMEMKDVYRESVVENTPPVSERTVSERTVSEQAAHISRMAPSYMEVFTAEEIEHHTLLAERLNNDNLVEVEAAQLADKGWRLTVVAYDYLGELSLICGLIFVYGCTIVNGHVFTYEPERPVSERADYFPSVYRLSSTFSSSERRKIVDVFTVYPEHATVTTGTWQTYARDLGVLLRLMHDGQPREARGLLAKRWANTLQAVVPGEPSLYPIAIQIDNTLSDPYTVLHIDALDTSGFLYEFTNALAYNRIHIAQMTVDSIGKRVHDTLYVTDANGYKITTPEKLRQLRVASVLIKHFTHLLPQSPNPESALLYFRQFIGQLFQREDWPDELASLERPDVLSALARLLGVSDFLWEDFLRMQHANLFPVVRDVDALATMKTRSQLQTEIESELQPIRSGSQSLSEDAPWRRVLNDFKDREMFRIDMRHILGHTAEFWDFSEELTALAEVVVNSVYHLCHEDLRTVYGTPRLDNGELSEMAVCALGKCGGRELGFASDIELMFIYSGNGRTDGAHNSTTRTQISVAEFYEKLVESFVTAIRTKREGIFEIDLQLRPYGKSGSMAVSLESFQRYFAPDGPAWAYERQALVRLRPIAGNPGLGEHVAQLRDAFVYTGQPFDVTAMRAMRERQVRHLVTGGTFNAKYSPGGLVDVEYLVQGLQITHGHRIPALRLTNTRATMAALAEVGLLRSGDYTRLRKAHTFLQWLIDGLRMVRGNAKDLTVPPPDSEAFAFLARRLRYGDDVARLQTELTDYTTSVQELSKHLL
ncbi:MAG: glutamine synthetase adenylyltransferase [Anaerolineae bacterium]|nr:glutamine synthetase adenylyltransferase [Anaerolineae bacterium]